MKTSKKNTILIVVSVVFSSLLVYLSSSGVSPLMSRVLLTSYTTNSTRTNSVNQFCSGLSRTELVESNQQSANTFYKQQMKQQVSIDGNKLIVNLLQGNTDQAITTLNESTFQLAGFIGTFLVGLAVVLGVSPFLLCCCTCPHSCPVKCCRKDDDEEYTLCQLRWPVIVLTLALLLTIGASIAGFSQSKQYEVAMQSVSCASSIMLDDILNGNVTEDSSSFFLGLYQLSAQLTNLNGNLSSINTTMGNLKSTSANMTNTNTAAATAMTDVASIPANVDAGGNMVLDYNTPLNSASTTATITSTFPASLGSSTTGGYVGAVYSLIQASKTALLGISSGADNFTSQTTAFSSGISALITTVDDFASTLTSADNSFKLVLQNTNSQGQNITLVVQIFYGIAIGFASLMLLGVLLVAFCHRYHCRYLIYIGCFMLFWVALIGFISAFLFSVLAPLTYWGCEFMDTSFSSQANFQANMDTILTSNNTRQYIKSCLPTASGDLLSAFGGTSVHPINNLSSTLIAMQNFNVTYYSGSIGTGMTQLNSAITKQSQSTTTDIGDSSSLTVMSDISKYGSYSACTNVGFMADSWIPAITQSPTYVSCNIDGGNQATSTQCNTANLQGRTGNCLGCMDVTNIFASHTAKADVLTDLTARYSQAGCSTFNTELSNVWENYYFTKSQAMAPVQTRAGTASTSVTAYSNMLTSNIATTFSNTKTSLASAADSVTDPKYGLVAGLNCKLIGQDFQRISQTFCTSFFNILFFSRLTLGLASFGILFSLCCGTCVGVRYYKHSERKLNCIENQGLSNQDVHDVSGNNFVQPKYLE